MFVLRRVKAPAFKDLCDTRRLFIREVLQVAPSCIVSRIYLIGFRVPISSIAHITNLIFRSKQIPASYSEGYSAVAELNALFV